MSNIAFITTRKYIKSYNVLEIFQQINDEKFGGKLNISNENCICSITYNDDTIEFYSHGVRKIGCKHQDSSWMQYVMNVFHNEFGFIADAQLSDEGIEKRWNPIKNKYKSYSNYINELFTNSSASSRESYLKDCPEEMKDY